MTTTSVPGEPLGTRMSDEAYGAQRASAALWAGTSVLITNTGADLTYTRNGGGSWLRRRGASTTAAVLHASGLRAVSASTSTAFTQSVSDPCPATPDTAEEVQVARQFTAGELAGDSCRHYALPVLARIAPAAVEGVKDIDFTHRHLPLPKG